MSSSQIIEKVKAHPSLWQLSHPYFSIRGYRARTWIKIAKSLQTTDVNAIKKRWRHLKDTYRKELRRLAANQVTTSCWAHFSDLEFLTDDQEEEHIDTEAAEKQEESSETETELEEEQLEKQKEVRLSETKKMRYEQATLKKQKEVRLSETKKMRYEQATLKKQKEVRLSETKKMRYEQATLKKQKEVRLSETKKMRYEQATLKPRVDTKSQTKKKFRKIMSSLSKLWNAMENTPTDRNLKNNTDYMFLVSLLPTIKKFNDVQRLHFRGKINNWLMNALIENEQLCDNKALVQAQINEMNKFTLPKIISCTTLRDALTQ